MPGFRRRGLCAQVSPRPCRLCPQLNRRDPPPKRRRQLVGAREPELARLDPVHGPTFRAALVADRDRPGAEIAGVEPAMRARIREDRDRAAAGRLLRRALGGGPVVAAALLTRQPELGRSGRRSPRSTAGGRPEPCARLYLAVLAAIRCEAAFAATRARQIVAGTAFMQSVIACAHRLPHRPNALPKSGQPYARQSIR